MTIDEFDAIPKLLPAHVSRWARERPDDVAIIDADDGRFVSWREFATIIDAIALELLDMGLRKGDVAISMLPLLPEHVFFEYACFKIGVLFAPLDVRLKEDELLQSVALIADKAKLFLHLDNTDTEDRYGKDVHYPFKEYARAVKARFPRIKFIQFSPVEDAPRGWTGILVLMARARSRYLAATRDPVAGKVALDRLASAAAQVDPHDPVLIIYTTGTTGFPKPAMLTGAGITCQNMCMAKAFAVTTADRMLVNLPPSHVGCQTEQLMTTIYAGGISVLLHAFNAAKTMKAIQDYKITAFGQIPSLFVMEWRLPDYASHDISSLRFAIYGGQGVSRRFLERLSTMAPRFGTGLGLTEMSGFCSYTPLDGTVDDILASVGHDYPVSPLTIRKPMNADGSAGDVLPDGEIGEICYTGPQVFKGYYNNEAATRKAISTDGILYTGDLGFKDAAGLHLTGRGKFVIKPKGYQVFPPEIESHIEKLPEVAMAAVVGAKHEVFSEGVVAFVQLKKGKQPVDPFAVMGKINEHCKAMAGYKRPSLIVIVDEIPLNRVDKTDYKQLYDIVDKHVEAERAMGRWDARKAGAD